jgi:hypothetical protein
MGLRYKFSCTKCSLENTVSGRSDAGMLLGTVTIYCHQCMHLQDRVVRELRGSEELDYPLACSVSQKHSVSQWRWSSGSPCPHCGAKLVRDSKGIFWD